MSYKICFELPFLPKTTNAQTSMHWHAKAKEVKEIHRAVALVVGTNKPAKPLTQARLILTRFSSTCPDYDNLAISWKHVTDALVVCGVLEDDNMGVIGVPKFLWKKAPPKRGKIEIICEEWVARFAYECTLCGKGETPNGKSC